jgi:hypothetical protein
VYQEGRLVIFVKENSSTPDEGIANCCMNEMNRRSNAADLYK